MRIHILGICGTLMGSIALLAKAAGHQVTGSDQNIYPPMSDQLAAAGIDLADGYRAENIPADTELVIIGNANLPRGNPAVEYVLNQRIPYTSGAEWLGRYLLQDRWVIAIAGTHGKTTTTSMVAWILEQAGMAPGYLVGGVPANFGQSARLGETPFFVIEADEYDTSYFDRRSKFLHYHPRTAVLNNLEYDHADIFPDLEAITSQFHLLIRTIPGTGLIIHSSADQNLQALLTRGCWSETLTTGIEPEPAALTARLTSPDGSQFQVFLNGTKVASVQWSLSGEHNVRNALSALAAARHTGVTLAQGAQALCSFQGVKRRMEVIYQSSTVTIYDDFAHHPTAIRTTLDGLRQKAGNAKILAIIEPGSHTMRKGTHAETLADATVAADQVIWFRPQNIQWDMASHLQDSQRFSISDNIEALLATTVSKVQELKAESAEGEPVQLVIMSNSGFQGFHQKLISQQL
ncbi:MAG: UDP-N-acetylmuramate:L-alanyl-gamma-D-glutamyl-meso-diaminopimelate ligase [Pseudomonadales bacterium]|nr:UDP-N-acetylmuramate:L-alanyl-gamma-D-glutamyl-meso-diaminopimelate ligase [Pseudomonadales bacterium]